MEKSCCPLNGTPGTLKCSLSLPHPEVSHRSPAPHAQTLGALQSRKAVTGAATCLYFSVMGKGRMGKESLGEKEARSSGETAFAWRKVPFGEKSNASWLTVQLSRFLEYSEIILLKVYVNWMLLSQRKAYTNPWYFFHLKGTIWVRKIAQGPI